MNVTQSIFYHCFKLHMPQHPRKQQTIVQAGERHGTVLDDLGENKSLVRLLADARRGERQPWKNNTRVHASERSKYK
jgi:hypothetical protein